MADLSDEDDLCRYSLVRQQLEKGHKISWQRLWKQMELTGKTQRQLQIRPKTLKRTYGTDLEQFPVRFTKLFGQPQPIRNNTVSNLDGMNVPRVVGTLFESVSRHQLHPRCSAPEFHTGELRCTDVTSILSPFQSLLERMYLLMLDLGSATLLLKWLLNRRLASASELKFNAIWFGWPCHISKPLLGFIHDWGKY
ncbi:unnamed protein product [Phytophthora fragariaefolia]|uniref:Unnamed protein product n=1 Tax=Phytophthora fragariaefolia TaxID=1490495 RepID=A0A9W6YK45_9STRA|nr:unnamed protein product [Phytophthora fragariaefolia]